jgi:hypothetical protein
MDTGGAGEYVCELLNHYDFGHVRDAFGAAMQAGARNPKAYIATVLNGARNDAYGEKLRR